MNESPSPTRKRPGKPNFVGVLPDKRLAARGSALLSDILAACSSVIARITRDASTQIAYYRFVNNERVEATDLVSVLTGFCKELARDRHVLVIQDTTELNYRHHKNWMNPYKIGPVGNNVDPGFFLHPSLVVDAIKGCPLGFADIFTWMRDYEKEGSASRNYYTTPREEKESNKWIASAQRSKEALDKSTRMTIVADQEADIYEFFAYVPDQRTDLIVRCNHNRVLLEGDQKLHDLIESRSPVGTYRFQVQGEKRRKDKKRTRHEALMELRFVQVKIRRPRNLKADAPEYVEMTAVEVKEHPSTVPLGEDPIHWILLTTHKVEDFASARQIVDWYRQRWHIEQVFRILKKKGLQMEDARLQGGDALIKLAIMSLHASIKILQASLSKNASLEIQASMIFTSEQIQYLWLIKEKYEGKTEKLKNPFPPESLAWAAWTIARLGAWKGYASQGSPGPTIMKRGLEKFENMAEAIELLG
jgi:hypothetical protein